LRLFENPQRKEKTEGKAYKNIINTMHRMTNGRLASLARTRRAHATITRRSRPLARRPMITRRLPLSRKVFHTCQRMGNRCHYKVLGLDKAASKDEIEKAYTKVRIF
jgi:hypothetical protein